MILPLVLILILIIINYYSYSYYCVINQKNFLLLFGIRNKNTMKAELIFDDSNFEYYLRGKGNLSAI